MSSDSELTRLAAAALLKDAILGATRASIAGPSGWRKPNRCAPNKAFLSNTIRGALSSNRVHEKKLSSRSDERRREHEAKVTEANRYRKVFLKASTKRSNNEDKPDPPSSQPVHSSYINSSVNDRLPSINSYNLFNQKNEPFSSSSAGTDNIDSARKRFRAELPSSEVISAVKPKSNASEAPHTLIWTEDNSLEIKPVTKSSLKLEKKDKILLKARRKFRSLKFVAATDVDSTSGDSSS